MENLKGTSEGESWKPHFDEDFGRGIFKEEEAILILPGASFNNTCPYCITPK
jgi:hypothetical protein